MLRKAIVGLVPPSLWGSPSFLMTRSLTVVAVPALAEGFARQASEVAPRIAERPIEVARRIAERPIEVARRIAERPTVGWPIVAGIILIAERRSVPPLTATATAPAATAMPLAIGSASNIGVDRGMLD